jgi:hypothetical protein
MDIMGVHQNLRGKDCGKTCEGKATSCPARHYHADTIDWELRSWIVLMMQSIGHAEAHNHASGPEIANHGHDGVSQLFDQQYILLVCWEWVWDWVVWTLMKEKV